MRNNPIRLAAGAAILASALALAGCNGSTATNGGNGDPETAATVNGVAIPVSKIDRIIDTQIKQGGQSATPLTPVALAAARLQVLEQLIQEEALFQRAQKENVIPTDQEVQQALQQQIQQRGMTQDQYQAQLKESGQTEEELKNDLKRTLAIQKLQEKVTASIPAPTDAELRKYFEENRQALVAPRGVDISVITVDPQNNGATDDAIGPEAAARKAQEIVTQIRAQGLDFATVARTRSEDPNTAYQGGVVGFYALESLQQTFPPDVANQLASLQPGQVTNPIQSQDGRFHIFKLNSRRDQQAEPTFEQASAQIARTVTEQRRQVVLSALVIDALAAADVKNNLADRIISNPDTFGALRPSPLTAPRPGAQPAPQQAAPANANAAPAAPANANAAPANTNAAPEAQPANP